MLCNSSLTKDSWSPSGLIALSRFPGSLHFKWMVSTYLHWPSYIYNWNVCFGVTPVKLFLNASCKRFQSNLLTLNHRDFGSAFWTRVPNQSVNLRPLQTTATFSSITRISVRSPSWSFLRVLVIQRLRVYSSHCMYHPGRTNLPASKRATEVMHIHRFWGLHGLESCEAVALSAGFGWSGAIVLSNPRHFVELTTTLKGPKGIEVDNYYPESSVWGARFWASTAYFQANSQSICKYLS